MSMRTWTDEEKEIGEEFMFAVCDENGKGDCNEIRRLILLHPWLVSDYDSTGAETWLGRAASENNPDVITTMLDLGFDINALNLNGKSTALETAIGFKCDDVCEVLLKRGIDVNIRMRDAWSSALFLESWA